MTDRLKYRWLAVGLVWALVLGLTGWNIHHIDRIQTDRRHLETMQMDIRFLQAKADAIQEVHRQKARLTHRVTSDDLGFLDVENNLKRLSWDLGLDKLSVKSDARTVPGNVMTITSVAVGTVPAMAGWLTAVEDAYPYLVISRMDLIYEPGNRTGRLQATFDYHFILSEPEPVS